MRKQAWLNLNLRRSKSQTGSGLFQVLHVHSFSAEWVFGRTNRCKFFKGAVQTLVLPMTMKAIIVVVCKCILTDTFSHYCHFVFVYLFACLVFFSGIIANQVSGQSDGEVGVWIWIFLDICLALLMNNVCVISFLFMLQILFLGRSLPATKL